MIAIMPIRFLLYASFLGPCAYVAYRFARREHHPILESRLYATPLHSVTSCHFAVSQVSETRSVFHRMAVHHVSRKRRAEARGPKAVDMGKHLIAVGEVGRMPRMHT